MITIAIKTLLLLYVPSTVDKVEEINHRHDTFRPHTESKKQKEKTMKKMKYEPTHN